MSTTRDVCGVCADSNTCQRHFGAFVCRACAAFFRRMVVSNAKAKCSTGGVCAIKNDGRGSQCRSCRMEKCLKIGMNKQNVQASRDRHDNSKQRNRIHLERPVSSIFATRNDTRLRVLYEHFNEMLSRRKTSLPRRKKLKFSHVGEAIQIFRKDVRLAYEWISTSFPELAQLPAVEQMVLYRNFYLKWNIYEPAYLAVLLGKTKTFYLPNGDMVDEVGRYYTRHLDSPPDVSLDHVSKVFTPYWTAFHSCIVTPVLAAGLSIYEFLLLAAIFLWDSGLDGLSQSTSELVLQIRRHLLFELTTVARKNAKNEEPEMRLARNMLLLNGVQKGFDIFEEELLLGSLYRILSPEDTDWYKTVNGPIFC